MSSGQRPRREPVGFAARHRFLLWVLWAHVPALAVAGLVIGVPVHEVALASLSFSPFAFAAVRRGQRQRVSALLVGLAMVLAGFVAIEFTEGAVMAHGYFFLGLGAVSVYRDRLVMVVYLAAVAGYEVIMAGATTRDLMPPGVHTAGMISLALLLMAGWRFDSGEGGDTNEEAIRFRMSFEQAPIGMAVVRPSGELVEVNPAFASLLGYDQGSLAGVNIATLVHPDDQGELGEAWEEMGNGERHSATEWLRCIASSGAPLWSRVSFALVPRAGSAPAMVIAQVEAANEAQGEQQRLETLLQGRDEFIAATGEEIRERLEIMIDLAETGDRGETTSRLGAHARDTAAIVDNLVLSARSASRPVPVVAHRLDAETLCRSVLAAIPGGTDVDLGFESGELWADPGLTRQIIASLVGNAIRYGGSHVELRVFGSGPDTVLAVIDDGPEIPESERERIFSGDLRNGTPVTRPASVGLGLTVGRNLARQMDGDLEYRRTSDSKNIFELRLPSEQISEAPQRIPA